MYTHQLQSHLHLPHHVNTITKQLQLTGSITQRNNTMDTMG